MNISKRYFFETVGLEAESDILDIIASITKKEWGKGAVKFSTQTQDMYEGTDIFVLGVPIDVTLAFEKKNKMSRVNSVSCDGLTIDFGIRFGNGKARFSTPVLVIGFSSAINITKSNLWVALDTIKSHARKIIETGMDSYFLAIED